jgi:polar amino acid transport system substrate-binding protein
MDASCRVTLYVGWSRGWGAIRDETGTDSLPPLQQALPGSRILDGAFQSTGVAIAVHKDRPAALAAVTDFVNAAKQDGLLRLTFDAAGLTAQAIAP